MNGRQAQTTTEFLVVLSTILVTFIVIFGIYTNRTQSIAASETLLSAKEIASKLGRSINQVYKAGNSSYEWIQLPPRLANNEQYNISIGYWRVEVSWPGQAYTYPIMTERVYVLGGNTSNVSSQTLVYGNVSAMAIGDGNNSGLNSLYAGVESSDSFYQILKDESFVELGDSGDSIYAICVADADPDLAGNEIYVGAYKTGEDSKRLKQFHWNGASFDVNDLGERSYVVVAMACGDGDNDGQDEIYLAREDSKDVYEFNKSGGAWSDTNISGDGFKVISLAVGDGDNDGLDEVYAGDLNSHIYKYEHPGAYTITDMGQQANDVLALAVGDGDNDGQVEAYFTLKNDANLYELLDDLTVKNRGGLGFKVLSLTVGDAFNQGINEIYMGDDDYNIYRYSTPYFDPAGKLLQVFNEEGVIKIAFV
jgi:hypothetical protein